MNISPRLQLWLLIGGAFLLGIFGIRSMWMSEGEERVRARIEASRARAKREAEEVENEVEALGPDALRDRATRWVRGTER